MLTLSSDMRGLLKAIYVYVPELIISTVLTYFFLAFTFIASIADDGGNSLFGSGILYKLVMLTALGAYIYVQAITFKSSLRNTKVNFYILLVVALLPPAYILFSLFQTY